MLKVLFQGRPDAYGAFVGGKPITVKEPLSPQVFDDHLRGKRRLGIFPIIDNRYCRWAAIDIDDEDFSKALAFRQRCAKDGLHAYIERSKSKGFHVWMFFKEPYLCQKVRCVIRCYFEELEFECEIFPKQDKSEHGRYGNYIFLPLFGRDIKDGKTVFLDENQKIYIASEESLSKIQHTDTAALDQIIAINELESSRSSKTHISPAPLSEKISNLTRNVTLTSLAGSMRRRGAGETAIYAALSEENRTKFDPPLVEKEIRKIAGSISKYPPGQVPRDNSEHQNETLALDELEPFPVISVQAIHPEKIQWQIQDLLMENAITVISGQPGSYKTWLSLELALSVASGKKALGVFDALAPGRVLYYNCEDDRARNTKARLEALIRGKGIEDSQKENLEFQFLDTHSLLLDVSEHKQRLEKTIAQRKPTLLVLDPWRNLHTQDENQSTAVVPILNYLRRLNREYRLSILLVVHDKKPNKSNSGGRPSMIRGSNAVEGWRDSLLMLDKCGDAIKVHFYHRAAAAGLPILFRLSACMRDEVLWQAQLNHADTANGDIETLVISLVTETPGILKTQLAKSIKKQQAVVYDCISKMISRGILVQDPVSKGLCLGSLPGSGK